MLASHLVQAPRWMRTTCGPGLELEPIAILADNYVWAVDDGAHALVVDPGVAAPVQAWLLQRGLTLAAILVTHHHDDHIGGLAALRAAWPAAIAIGPADERIGPLDRRVGDGDRIDLPAPALGLEVIAVPGHTRSHVAYHGAGLLFCGDTLFSAGCGRLFEGTPAQMLASLDRLAGLPGSTLVCCTHEYTAANCAFARQVEPGNTALAGFCDQVRALRAERLPTLPSSMARERSVNPFLRIDQAGVRTTLAAARGLAAGASRSEAFAALRGWKDGFRG
jgi:hydroxyacylglutathione hydrolase